MPLNTTPQDTQPPQNEELAIFLNNEQGIDLSDYEVNNGFERRNVMFCICIIVLSAFIITVALPAYVSHKNNTLYKDDLIDGVLEKNSKKIEGAKVPIDSIGKTIVNRIKCETKSKEKVEQTIYFLDSIISLPISSPLHAIVDSISVDSTNRNSKNPIDSNLKNIERNRVAYLLLLVKSRDSLKTLLNKNEWGSYRVVAFSESPQLILAFLLYISLGILIFVYPPRWKHIFVDGNGVVSDVDIEISYRFIGRNILQIISLSIAIFFLFQGELLIRNFLWDIHNSPLRKVYAYPNFDVNKCGFYVELFISAIFSFLLAVIWKQWLIANKLVYLCNKYSFNIIKERSGINGNLVGYNTEQKNFINSWKNILFTRMLSSISMYFTRWQERSVILGLGFISYPAYYYVLLNKYGDHRYFVGAITAHSLWLITWVLLSRPVTHLYLNWNKDKNWMLHFFEEGLFDKKKYAISDH